MMTITPTRRPWFTPGRLTLAFGLLALLSGAVLVFGGADAAAMACTLAPR